MALASSCNNLTSSSGVSGETSFTPAFAGGNSKDATLVNASTATGSTAFIGFFATLNFTNDHCIRSFKRKLSC